MVTIFSTCKPFKAEVVDWQTNAILSWRLMTSSIVLFGDDLGVGAAAERFGCTHAPNVACNERGRPLINAMFDEVQYISLGEFFCYINADNMVMGLVDAFIQSASRFSRFLLVGRRYDWIRPSQVDIVEGWQDRHWKGRLHNEWALEYFGFTRGLFRELPPFWVGWPGWDNWLVLHALQIGIPVIDVTRIVTCIHHKHASSWRGRKDDPQCKWNLDLASDLVVPGARGSVDAAPWILEKDGKIRQR